MPWVVRFEPGKQPSPVRVLSEPDGEAPIVERREPCIVVLGGYVETESLPGDSGGGIAERLADSYLRTGTGFLQALRGSFALLLWDERDGRLLALRDPTGSHPLFYREEEEAVAFSPSPDAVAGVPRKVDRLTAAAHVLSVPAPIERTFYIDVKRLPPGHVLERESRSTLVRRYWTPRSPGQVASGDDTLEAFQEVLHRAIRRCLRFSPLAVYLSGGLDSGAIATAAVQVCAQQQVERPLALLTFFRGTSADEERVQRTVVQALDLPFVGGTPEELLDGQGLLREAIALARRTRDVPPQLIEPLYDRLAGMARTIGCRGILSGMGGDDWLLPNPFHAAERLVALDVAGVLRLAKAWRVYWPDFGVRDSLAHLVWPYGVRPLLRRPAVLAIERLLPGHLQKRRYQMARRALPAWIPDGELRDELSAIVSERPLSVPIRDLPFESKLRLLENPTQSLMQEDLYTAGERTGMRVLAPLLDPDVVSFLLSVDPGRLVAAGRGKAFAAELAGAAVTDFGSDWPSTVYGDSVWTTTVAAEAAEWHAIGGLEVLNSLGVVDQAKLAKGLNPPGGETLDAREAVSLARAMTLDVWLRTRILSQSD
ncbi:MAG TPA: asparagine synthase-related protein [Gaiellaceae bacterium]|nr:asparagine synthase-related protein [Gaiellaceae bacterium]